ncbi:hypothetical protein [Geopsychrobacter electrodiphilus]|uniref:hypothetical protein n=1 Tax=Geopsychrobacter electrodiphilus TaxID=225196 RepID=UPI000379AB9E|nr:hypothetical protein [Geopsychrobacter electrodiphilus]
MQMTRVVPVWIKVAGLLLVVGFFCLQIFGKERPISMRQTNQVITPEPSLNHGLAGKAVANTKQITAKLFSPVVEANSSPIILRATEDKPYYQDEEADK